MDTGSYEARNTKLVPAALLDPGAEVGLWAWTRERLENAAGTALVLAVGPEGGLSGDERDQLASSGARAVTLGPHVLRIETAAEAAAAIVAHAASS